MKETKIEIPAGCEVEKTEITDGALVVTFKKKEPRLPKSFEAFCEMNPRKESEYYIDVDSYIEESAGGTRQRLKDKNLLPDRETAEAVLALCQLIQLRNCYNGDWVPNWLSNTNKYVIDCNSHEFTTTTYWTTPVLLYFETEELRDEFLRNFCDLIEKLKPLYGIREGGEE